MREFVLDRGISCGHAARDEREGADPGTIDLAVAECRDEWNLLQAHRGEGRRNSIVEQEDGMGGERLLPLIDHCEVEVEIGVRAPDRQCLPGVAKGERLLHRPRDHGLEHEVILAQVRHAAALRRGDLASRLGSAGPSCARGGRRPFRPPLPCV